MSIPSHQRAIIAGAGPAGLTAAYELAIRTGIKPIVYEMTDAIGGISQTYNYKGNRIDIGGHRFFSKSKRVTDWWLNQIPLEKSAVENVSTLRDERSSDTLDIRTEGCRPAGGVSAPVMLERNRISRIFYRRSFFPYPLGITVNVARRLGMWNTFLIGMSYLKAQWFPLKDETYLDAFFINRFGARLYETFFKHYTEKVWGVPCNQIRSDWGSQRIKGLSLRRAVAHAVKDLFSSDFAKQQKERETSLITRFWYPQLGPGQMWETVTEKIRNKDGEVHLERRISGVHLENGRVASVTVEDVRTGNTEEVACNYFFSTMPIKHLIGMIRPHPPERVVEVADGLRYRDFLTVGLLLKKLHVQGRGKKQADTMVPDNWIYIQEGDVQVGRVQIFNNWSPHMVTDPDTVWIGLEYFVNEGEGLWVMEDEELIDLGIRELETIGFIRKEDVLDGCVRRMPKAYPAYFGSYEQLSVVREYTDAIPNLYLIGRNGMHRYNNQDHSMLTAITAVDNIVEGKTEKTNIWEVNTENAYHEEK